MLLIYKIQLVIPGPEQPLVDGIQDLFKKGTPRQLIHKWASLSLVHPLLLLGWKDPRLFQRIS